MKRLLTVIVVLLFLPGCGSENDCLQKGLALRERLLSNSCSFTAEITADYGDKTYSFSMGCTADANGDLKFIVRSPESISGIAGTLTAGSGFLTFEDKALAFPLLADGELSPVSAPWLLIKTLRSGYLSSAGMVGDGVQLVINDSYEEDALRLDILLDENDLPAQADILWQGRRVLSVTVKDFTIV